MNKIDFFLPLSIKGLLRTWTIDFKRYQDKYHSKRKKKPSIKLLPDAFLWLGIFMFYFLKFLTLCAHLVFELFYIAFLEDVKLDIAKTSDASFRKSKILIILSFSVFLGCSLKLMQLFSQVQGSLQICVSFRPITFKSKLASSRSVEIHPW